MRFWDASAIVPLIVIESVSERMEACAREDPAIVAWWGTRVECTSAIRRRERDGNLSADDATGALHALSVLGDAWVEVMPSERVRSQAVRLLAVHSLRAADSLQLAAALAWREGDPAGSDLVCLDDRLGRAATLEGFNVLSDRR